jgi:hypothetical protein
VALCRFQKDLLSCRGDPAPTGPCFAVIARCRVPGYRGPHVTVVLHATEEAARAALRHLDDFGCGGDCWRRHEVVDMAGTAKVGVEEADGTPRRAAKKTVRGGER